MCSCDYGEMPEFFDYKDRKARKEHHCEECPFPIEKNEIHHVATGKWDGQVSTLRRHLACHEASAIEEGCISAYSALIEDMRDCGLQRGHPSRKAWAKHLWRFRKHPKALGMRFA